jgi:hypothetical protein
MALPTTKFCRDNGDADAEPGSSPSAQHSALFPLRICEKSTVVREESNLPSNFGFSAILLLAERSTCYRVLFPKIIHIQQLHIPSLGYHRIACMQAS